MNILQNMDAFTDEQSLSTVVWSFAKDNRGEEFWDKAARHFSQVFERLSTNALASCIWAFGKRR